MKRLIIYFLLLLASVWVGLKIHKDPGYVLISYQSWNIETTLWFALISIVIVFLILYFLLRLLRGTSMLGGRFGQWFEQRKSRKANRLTNQGLCQLAEGDWHTAEKNLLKGAKHSETPLINYLAAASAAAQLGHDEDRDSYLRAAHEANPEAEVAIGLTQAQLQFGAKQWELALATLRHLNQIAPGHRTVLRLLKRVYLELSDWESLRALLPELRERKILEPQDLHRLEQKIYYEILLSSLRQHDSELVNKVWLSLPKELQSDSQILDTYSIFLIQQQQTEKAEALIREALKKNWQPLLVKRYGIIKSPDLAKQLITAETWLKMHNNDPVLQLTLGRLAKQNQLWTKAKDYLERSRELDPTAETYKELGDCYEQCHDPVAALACYRSGLQLVL